MIKYLATAHYDGFDISCETYEMDVLMDFLFEHEKTYQDVINADTGEVLYIGNNPSGEDYIEDEFKYTTIRWTYMGESEPEPDPREEIIRGIMEVCEEFGVKLRIPI